MHETRRSSPNLHLYYLLFYLVPKNLVSFIAGWLARLKLPEAWANRLKAAFVRAYKLDLTEAEYSLEAYRTLEDLFTRRLRPGARSIAGRVCSPADGFLARSAPVRAHTAVQAKGLSYSLNELIYAYDEVPADFSPAWYQTIYLAPHNYHRVHAPATGRLLDIRYFPGELWPVNQTFVAMTPRLFTRNERLVFSFELEKGGRLHVVMVGALNVGRMVTPLLPTFVANDGARQWRPLSRHFSFPERPVVRIGEEIGTFMLGSTVVLVYEQAALEGINLLESEGNTPILMGQAFVE